MRKIIAGFVVVSICADDSEELGTVHWDDGPQ